MSKPLSASMLKLLDRRLTSYEAQFEGSPGQKYINGRGLSNETARYFRLGWTGNPEPEDSHLSNRVTIPYLKPAATTSIRYRAIDPGAKPKIQGLTGIAAKQLYNTRALYGSDEVFICEGEIDTMTMHQAGFAAVGVAGVSNWDPAWKRIFRMRKVIVVADNDDAGQGEGLAREIQSVLNDCSMLALPEGHDLNSYYCAEGEDALQDLVARHIRKIG